nr:hypothetical protein [Bacillus cereus]
MKILFLISFSFWGQDEETIDRQYRCKFSVKWMFSRKFRGNFYIYKGKVLEVKIGEGDIGITGTCFKALDKGKFLIGN